MAPADDLPVCLLFVKCAAELMITRSRFNQQPSRVRFGAWAVPQHPSEGPQWYDQPTSRERFAETTMRRKRPSLEVAFCCLECES